MKLLQKDATTITAPASPAAMPSSTPAMTTGLANLSAPSKPVTLSPHDKIRFGMAINTASGCCVEKVKTGRKGGCCSHIEHQKFIGLYSDAVARETKEKGIKPKLDPEIKAILDAFTADLEKSNIKAPDSKKVQVLEKSVSTPVMVTGKPSRSKEPLWKRVLMTPVRFIQWLVIGFWQDLRLIFSGKRSS